MKSGIGDELSVSVPPDSLITNVSLYTIQNEDPKVFIPRGEINLHCNH